ncbi:MAG: uroporphyrinogen decarboxylase family protein [Armatimonadota bacterium]
MEFQPVVYEHAAALIGRTPWEVSRDAELLYTAHAEAHRTYHHRPITVGMDIYNVEAEAYGAEIGRPGGTEVPAVAHPPFASVEELLALPPLGSERLGRFSLLIEAGRRLTRDFPEADIRIPLSGPFSIASALIGFESLLCEVVTDPDPVREALLHLARGQRVVCEAVCAAGIGITLFESAATPPLLSPALFQSIVLPALMQLVSDVSGAMKSPAPCIIGGNTAPILDALLATGTKYVICPFETDQPAFMRQLWKRTDVRVRVNMNARPLVTGPWEAIQNEANRVLALAHGRENTCIGPGALPYEALPEYVKRVREYLAER